MRPRAAPSGGDIGDRLGEHLIGQRPAQDPPRATVTDRVDTADGSFVQISDAQVDVPLFRQCWKLDSPMITRITDVVQSAASTLRKSRH